MRYWMYSHNADDPDLLVDLGYANDFGMALSEVSNYINSLDDEEMQTTVTRIVDEDNASQTCWLAGPEKYMREFYAAHFGVEDKRYW